MELSTSHLWAKGGLYETTAPCLAATTAPEVLQAFLSAEQEGQRCTLVGARKSFGEQFLPPPGQLALDVSRLDVGVQCVEDAGDTVWVRAGGGTTFAELRRSFPDCQAHCPPTSDGISIAGALSACTHNSAGYLADAVRAFTLVAPNGQTYRCAADSAGLAGELFRHVPGAFGLLGAVTDIELRLDRIGVDRHYLVHALHTGTARDDTYLEQYDRVADEPRYSWGRGLVVYGNRGAYIILGDELLPPGTVCRGRQALLTDDNLEHQAMTQGVANRFPRVAEYLLRRTYPQGKALHAPWYGFQFFQRSYDLAHEVLSRPGLFFGTLRQLGVDPKLTVCHQTWFYPRAATADFMNIYWQTMKEFPGIERRMEQQDLVILPRCGWPSHSMGVTVDDLGALTSSFAVRRDVQARERVSAFFREVSTRAHAANPRFRVSLCKQMHCAPQVLAEMHHAYIQKLSALKAQVDPGSLITSRFWQTLCSKTEMTA